MRFSISLGTSSLPLLWSTRKNQFWTLHNFLKLLNQIALYTSTKNPKTSNLSDMRILDTLGVVLPRSHERWTPYDTTHGSFSLWEQYNSLSSDLYKKCPSDDSPAYQKANLLQVNWWQQKKPCPDLQAGLTLELVSWMLCPPPPPTDINIIYFGLTQTIKATKFNTFDSLPSLIPHSVLYKTYQLQLPW